MKILYGIQGTGNGHFTRAAEIIPCLEKHGELDLLVSGIQADVPIAYPIKYKMYGMGFIFGKKGGVDIWQTLKTTRPVEFIKDVRSCPVERYDLVINDFEPISAWACKLRKQPCVAISHQSAFFSDKTPRPAKRRYLPEWVIRNYAPTSSHIAFHFSEYDSFINTPIIKKEIRTATPTQKDHIVVYLPAISEEFLIQHFRKIKSVRWKIFSKHTKTPHILENVEIYPISQERWITAFASAEGALLGGGFEAPSEALYLGKKLLVVPMTNQYEQQCNAAALQQMGVKICHKVNKHFSDLLKDWLKNVRPIKLNYADETEKIIRTLVQSI